MRSRLLLSVVVLAALVSRAHADGAITKNPVLTTFVEAVYPPAEKAAGKTASVVLEIAIGADGKVGEVTVTTSAGADFDAAAIAAAKQFVFSPAEIDGKAAPVKITYKYDFTIKEEMVSLGPQINFEGVIVERFKKAPLPNITVAIKDLNLTATTDANGAFAFTDVPVGKHDIEVSGPGMITVETDEEITEKQKRTVKYYLEEQDQGVDEEEVVRATRIKKDTADVSIRTEEARKVPGTQGDTLKVVQNLPGVGRSSFGSGQLVVWGSAPADTRVYIDGVEIPSLYHGGGLRATVNSDLVKSIELSPGAYGAEYGRGLGGMVEVDTRTLPKDGTHGYVAADVIDSSAMVSTSVGSHLRVGVAGRISYLDRVLSSITSDDVGQFVPIPRYHDGQLVVQGILRKDEELRLVALTSDDKLTRTIAASDPAEQGEQDTHDWFHRLYLRYARILPDGSSFAITPSIGYDGNITDSEFGGVPTQLDIRSWRYAVRGGYRRKLGKGATLSLGVDAAGQRTEVMRVGSVNLPPREGDISVFGQAPGDDVNADDWTTSIVSVAPYGFVELTHGKWTITPGLRLEPFLIDGSRLTPVVGSTPSIGYRTLDLAIDPRLSAVYQASKRLQLKVGGGLYHQPPDPSDLSAVFGNPTLGPSRAIHLSAGGDYKLTGTMTLELLGFYKSLDDLASRNELATPPLAAALTEDGIGRSYGGQVLLRQELAKGFFGWITYSLIRSERRDHADTDWRLFDYDQTHVLGVLASYDLGHGWQAGGRFRYATGAPRTPVVDTFYDTRGDDFEPIFGAQNSIRIPAFYQLDARVERTAVVAGYQTNVFLDVQNLTNRKNPEEIIYNFDYTQRKTISGLPTLAVVGLRVEF